jgi:GTPase SAR1 family protein
MDSFNHTSDWLSEVNRYASEGTCKLLVGNKSDRPDRCVRLFFVAFVYSRLAFCENLPPSTLAAWC